MGERMYFIEDDLDGDWIADAIDWDAFARWLSVWS